MQDSNPYELIYMSRLGDSVAYRLLFQTYKSKIEIKVNAAIRSYRPLHIYEYEMRQACFEALQDALISYRKDSTSQFSTYVDVLIGRAVTNCIRHVNRRSTIQAHEMVGFDEEVGEHHNCGYFNQYQNVFYNTQYYLRFQEAYKRFQDTYKHLSKSERYVYESFQEGLSYDDASLHLDISKSQYSGRLYRVKQKLKNSILGF